MLPLQTLFVTVFCIFQKNLHSKYWWQRKLLTLKTPIKKFTVRILKFMLISQFLHLHIYSFVHSINMNRVPTTWVSMQRWVRYSLCHQEIYFVDLQVGAGMTVHTLVSFMREMAKRERSFKYFKLENIYESHKALE